MAQTLQTKLRLRPHQVTLCQEIRFPKISASSFGGSGIVTIANIQNETMAKNSTGSHGSMPGP